jgi:hypothetical protein
VQLAPHRERFAHGLIAEIEPATHTDQAPAASTEPRSLAASSMLPEATPGGRPNLDLALVADLRGTFIQAGQGDGMSVRVQEAKR